LLCTKIFLIEDQGLQQDISLPIRALADSAITSRAIVRYLEEKSILLPLLAEPLDFKAFK
jgi:hypothetical protein